MEDKGSFNTNKTDKSKLTLSQAILAPIEAILQAQVHSARSFLNLILQMGFRHKAVDDIGNMLTSDTDDDNLYRLEFFDVQVNQDGTPSKYKISIPTISALPLNPLAISESEIEFKMRLEGSYESARQFSKAQKTAKREDSQSKNFNESTRPWFLIDDPVELKGTIAPESNANDLSLISIKIKMNTTQVPAALGKFIASVSDFSKVEIVEANTTEN
ncbi:DUF2589 domain-containing protein [Paraglaciecola chathamensis]|uniref:DUF2589 domain-containing protein n=1 Tax=Paraglaciecola chathamensis TaxID=368405 RepID=UPI002702A46B|nr:DUF2589 domain-containing protein [Paraglaciecola chathamensis]MDO6557618.1 DUF2589 domain-containing protein [Paraglaciecola chathamensis]